MSTITRRMRTNAGQIILASNNIRRGGEGSPSRVTNQILDVARDCYSGSISDWALDVLWVTQILRVAYDSPRIGGGIDPAIATGVPSWEDALMDEGSMFEYIVGRGDGDITNPLEHLTADEVQDMIVHAEAVALLALAVYPSTY